MYLNLIYDKGIERLYRISEINIVIDLYGHPIEFSEDRLIGGHINTLGLG